jgi:hypothetical protein
MELTEGSDLYFADYGDLRLEVCRKVDEGERVFEFRVIDTSDGGVLWIGCRSDLEAAQDSALFEAQTFVASALLAAPQWQPK